MDFYSSYYTIPRDDSMSSSPPENELRTPSDKHNSQIDTLDHQNPTELQIVYSLETESNYDQNKNVLFTQNSKIMLNQNYIPCNYQDLQLNKCQDKVFIYDALNNSKKHNQNVSSIFTTQTLPSYSHGDNIYNNIVKKTQLKSKNDSHYHENSHIQLYKVCAQQNIQLAEIKNEEDQSEATLYQQNQNNNFQLNYCDSQIQKTDSRSQRINIMNESKVHKDNLEINQLDQRRVSSSYDSQIHQNANNFDADNIKQQESPYHLNSSNQSNKKYNSNNDPHFQKDILKQKNTENLDQRNNKHYTIITQHTSDLNSNTTIHQDSQSYSENYQQQQQQLQSQLNERQQEQFSLRNFSYVNIFQSQNLAAKIQVENKILLEGGVIVDLNEFVHPQIEDTLSKTISQHFYIDQLQKYKKYIIANLQLKTTPETEISKVIDILNQYKENEKAINLVNSLSKYKAFLQERKQQQQEQIQIANSLILIGDSALKVTENQMNKMQQLSQTQYNATTNSFSSIQNLLTSPSVQTIQNQKEESAISFDPYSSVQRINFNLSQASKILKQFEKYCYTFRITRKSPALIESLQVGVSTSFIEMIGCNFNTLFSSILRNDSSSMLPFDYAGYSASELSIDQIYQIITPFKEKQKHYNRKQSLKYGEIKHSCGKNIKVKIQQKVFLLNTYQSFDQKCNSQVFCEENFGDYLEIKLYTPETLEIQKISKKRTSSSRKGQISEEECLEIDQNENKKIYSNQAQILIDKFYSDDSLLSPELIFKKKWTIKNHNKKI